jgi:tetratricopeptide (TPR) repeat protein
MMTMVEDAFQQAKPKVKFTQKVLDEIMAEGRKHLFAMEWSEAEATFLKAIEMKPNHAEAHFYVGYVKENQEVYKEAAK